jgi:hypothetical protein
MSTHPSPGHQKSCVNLTGKRSKGAAGDSGGYLRSSNNSLTVFV